MNPASQADDAWKALPEAERNQTFQSKTLWQRALIVFAGPAVNFILAILIFMGFLLAFGKSVTPPVLDVVQAGSPAAIAGLQPGRPRAGAQWTQAVETFDQMANEVIMIPGEKLLHRNRTGWRKIEPKRWPLRLLKRSIVLGINIVIGRIGVGASEVEIREVGLLEAPLGRGGANLQCASVSR